MIEKIIKGIKYRLDEENLTAEVIQKKGYDGDVEIQGHNYAAIAFKKSKNNLTNNTS